MCYLVSVDHNGMAAHLTRSERDGFKEVLYIHCNGWDWWYVEGWQGKKMGMLTDSEDGNSATDQSRHIESELVYVLLVWNY